MRKAILLVLALAAAAAASGSAPRPVAAGTCFWYCTTEGSVVCSCGSPRLCPWPPPPIACP